MSEEEEREISDTLTTVFGKEERGEDYVKIRLSDITPTERRLLLERNIINQEYTLQKDRDVFVHKGKDIYGITHDIDHLRLVAYRSGLDIRAAHSDAGELDSLLEDHLDFAASLDMGYLTTQVTNIGTGLKGSVMLHLPALSRSGLMDRATKAVIQIGFEVKGFFDDDEASLGNIYQIANQYSFGETEQEILEKLENVTAQVVNYERKVREESVEKKRLELEDEIFRAYGILGSCRLITAKEAIELLLQLRLGAVFGWLDLDLGAVTGLLFGVQRAHVQYGRVKSAEYEDPQQLDYERAEMIREKLNL
jgi:protein arginine kinase